MLRFVLRRLLLGVLTMLIVSGVTFVLFFGVPADPARVQCGQRCTAEQIQDVRERLGIDRPIAVQYAEFMRGIFVGRTLGEGENATECSAPCLGESYLSKRQVSDIVGDALPVTASIAIGALFFQVLLGVSLGMLAALKRGTVFDKLAVGAALVGAAMPVYFFAATLMLVFRYTLEWLPQPAYISPFTDPGGFVAGLIMPWLSIALIGFAFETRMTRSQMLETLDEDFIRTSRAKGLRDRVVYGRHALRASITPIATSAGLTLAALFGGALITETVFGLRGMGYYTVDAVGNGDMPIAMATVLLAAFFVVLSTMLVDMLYAVIDPRVRLS